MQEQGVLNLQTWCQHLLMHALLCYQQLTPFVVNCQQPKLPEHLRSDSAVRQSYEGWPVLGLAMHLFARCHQLL
jgi:hypothetical protein